MPLSLRRLFALGISLFPALQFLPPVIAQDISAGISSEPISGLRRLTQNSGYIFDGTVLSVERVEADAGSVDLVQITFRVEQGIRGVRNGQVVTIREWGGLWNSGQRYRSGERLLLFLYKPSKLGLTSPVDGPLGRIAVDSGGNAIFDRIHLAARYADQPTGKLHGVAAPASRAKATVQSRISTRTLALAIQRMARE